MRDESEMELVELVQQELEGSPFLDQPSVWESEINRLIEDQREKDEQAAMARDFRPTVEALQSPSRVAHEMRSRSRFLRTKRIGRRTKQLELDVLAELDAIEAEAGELDRRWKGCEISAGQMAAGMDKLALAVFAVRGRFATLLERQDLPFPSRAQPPDPEERRRELEQIEAFLARKKARGEGGQGGSHGA